MAITKIQSESLNLADTYDFTGTVTGAGESNVPAFSAYGADAVLSDNTVTKLVFGTEVYDTDSAYDTSNGRFTVPSGEGGKYFFHAKYRIESDSGHIQIEFYKNGSEVVSGINREENGYGTARYISVSASYSTDLSAADYIEAYARIVVGNTNGIVHPTFLGFKISS